MVVQRNHDQSNSDRRVGDFNADGKMDMAGYISSGAWRMCLSNSAGTDFDCAVWGGHSGGPANNLVGDFNRDGRSDLAAYVAEG